MNTTLDELADMDCNFTYSEKLSDGSDGRVYMQGSADEVKRMYSLLEDPETSCVGTVFHLEGRTRQRRQTVSFLPAEKQEMQERKIVETVKPNQTSPDISVTLRRPKARCDWKYAAKMVIGTTCWMLVSKYGWDYLNRIAL